MWSVGVSVLSLISPTTDERRTPCRLRVSARGTHSMHFNYFVRGNLAATVQCTIVLPVRDSRGRIGPLLSLCLRFRVHDQDDF